MDAKAPTVEVSLEMLSEALAKAVTDLAEVAPVIDRARADIASHNTSITRRVTAAAERAVEHLAKTDEALKDVLVGLAQRD